MKLLQWFIGFGVLGVAMIVCGALGMFISRDGMVVGGSLIIGSVLISLAILASAKN